MLVVTQTKCPGCAKDGAEELLQYDVGNGRVECSKGHTYAGLKEIEAALADEAPTPSEGEPDAVAAEALAALEAPLAMTEPPVEVSQTLVSAPVTSVTLPSEPPVPVPPTNGEAKGVRRRTVAERLMADGFANAPNGDLYVAVSMPETYVEAVREAAVRYFPSDTKEEAFRKHMQQFFERALEYGWLY